MIYRFENIVSSTTILNKYLNAIIYKHQFIFDIFDLIWICNMHIHIRKLFFKYDS